MAEIDPDELMMRKSSGGSRLFLVLAIAVPLSVGAGVGLGFMAFGGKPPPPPTVASAVTPAPAPPPSAEEPTTLSGKAAAGDFKAIDELKARSPDKRTVEETVALARGRAGNKARALEGFAAEIKKNPDILKEDDPRARLREFFTNPHTTYQAGEVIAALAGPLGPDLLFDVSASTKQKGDLTQFADELLETKELRDKATPALLVALDLRRATECEAAKALLPKAKEQGDRRAIPLLAKLASKKGCGPDKRDDCYECLRDLDKDKEAVDLGDAMGAARRRAPPKP